MLFQRKIMNILNPDQLPHLTEKITYHGKLISVIFWAINWGHDRGNGICNDSVGLVILSAYSSSYSKVEDYKIENKTHLDIEYQMRKKNGDCLDFNFIWFPSPAAKNWVNWVLSICLWKIMLYMFLWSFWNVCEWQIYQQFPLCYIIAWQHFLCDLCFHPILLCECDSTSVASYNYLRESYLDSLFKPNFRWHALY